MSDSANKDKIEQDLEDLRTWMKNHPLLPDELEPGLLRRFLHSCYYDLNMTKKCLEIFFTTRSSCGDLLNNRDPCSKEMKEIMEITNVAYIQRGDTDLMLWQLNDPGMDQYSYVGDVKLFFMTSDAWLLDNPRLEDKVIVVLDAKDVSMKFISTFKFSVAKKIGQYQQEAMPLRLKEVHVINAPGFIDKLYAIMKPFLSNEITKMINFHKPNSDTLYNYVNKDDLPKDFGGQLPSMKDLMQSTVKALNDKRELLMRNDLWRCKEKESKNHKVEKKVVAESPASSFRTLSID